LLMRWIVGSSLRFRWLVIFAAVALMIFGIGETRNADVDVFPEFAPPQVEIQTIAIGNSSEQVEELITVPLEDQLNGIPGLEEMRSKSVADLSQIQLIFSRDVDLYESRQLVQERLTAASPNLPTWATPPWMMPPLSSTSRILKIGITSDELNMREMSVVAYWKIRQELLRVDGVANVAIWGEHLQQQQVYVDPEKLAEHGISLEQVMDQTGDSLDAGLLRYSEGAVIGTGGFVQADGQRLDVRNVLPIVTPDDLAKIPLEGSNGTNVRLDDVARVGWGHQPLIGDAVIDDGRGIMLIVQKFPNANTLEVTRGIEETVDDMRPGLPAMELDTTIFRPATFIEQAFGNLTRALLLGVLLVVLILAAFLFEWRTAFISLIAIPLSLLAAILVLQAFGTVINVMILAGLIVAIGVVVDDAIIDVENVVRRLRQERSEGTGKSTIAIVLEASVEVRTAITYATLINVIAVVPVFFLEGLSGAFFKPLVLSYGIAVLVSMIVALTVTPALCLIMLSRGHRHQESPLLRVLKRGYGAGLARVIPTPSPAIITVAVVMLAGVVVAPTLGTILLPSFKERDFLMHWLAKPGTSQPEEFRISVRACKDLQEIPGVRNCGSHIGQAFQSDEPYGVDFGENWISINPAVDYDKTLASVSNVVDAYPGLYRDVQTYLRERVREVLTGTSEAIVVRIYGPELDVLYAKADEISHETRNSVSSVRELPIDTPGGEQITLEQVADVRLSPTPNAIERVNQSRRIDVGANVEGRDLGSAVGAVEDRLAEIELPPEYHMEVLGESSELAAAQKNLLIYGGAAALAILFLLQASFGSMRLALLLFLTLPMALVGGILAVWMGDGILSLGSLIGFLTVFGIAARNGILMISHFQHLEQEEGEPFGPALVLRGAKERLAPILMTAGGTGLALFPP